VKNGGKRGGSPSWKLNKVVWARLKKKNSARLWNSGRRGGRSTRTSIVIKRRNVKGQPTQKGGKRGKINIRVWGNKPGTAKRENLKGDLRQSSR